MRRPPSWRTAGPGTKVLTRALSSATASGALSEDPNNDPPGWRKQESEGSEALGQARQPSVSPDSQARPSCRTDGPGAPCRRTERPARAPPPTPDAASRGQRPAGCLRPQASRGQTAGGREAGAAILSYGAAGAGSHVPQPCLCAPPLGAVPLRARHGEVRAGAWRRRGVQGPRW